MGIPGIFKEIGKGERVALAKLAIDHLELSQRPLRIAIDAAIWNFQTQAGQGGKNPALRTLFYRLVKLLALPIDPVFVYDGKNKPLTKRGKTVSRYGSCVSNELSKRLVQAFRFPYHTAPGEAEAECAMLQRKGVVDAVMSQDVDAIMFGSALTLRDWSYEASKHNKSPTHVNVFDLPRIKRLSGLDPDGMILVALLSGGDYDEAGVTGIGSTLACEIARAGFGSDLVDLVRQTDEAGLQEWRERLEFELQTNESGYFKMRRKTLRIPESFPNREILGYYLNPAVTPEDQLPILEMKWLKEWESVIDIQALRSYVGETFDWLYKPGAWKLIRVIAPALLANGLRRGAATSHIRSVEQITERRKDFVSDGIPELRVTVIPAEIVGIDLDAEEDNHEDLESLAANENDEADKGSNVGDDINAASSPSKRPKAHPWLPTAPEKMWIAETIVDIGAREHTDRWRQIQAEREADPKKFATRKTRKQKEVRKNKDTGVKEAGALLNYVVGSKVSGDKDISADKASALPSPTRRAHTSVHRLSTATPQLQSTQPSKARPPTMQDFFKPSKSQHVLDAVGKVSKCSNPVVATDSDSIIPSPGPKPVALEQPSLEEPILVSSSPVPRAVRKIGAPCIEDAIGGPDDISHTVIQRRSRGQTKRGATLMAPEPTSSIRERPPMPTSPARSKRTIESFFAPYITATQQKPVCAEIASSQVTKASAVIPPDLTRGLETSPSTRHAHPVPRSSLPGTWREEDSVDGPVSQRKSSRRPPRVSIVDLTEG